MLIALLLIGHFAHAEEPKSLCEAGITKPEAIHTARSEISEQIARAKDRSTARRLQCFDAKVEQYADYVRSACQRDATDAEVVGLISNVLEACF